ncbi:hypothetical protein PSPO_a1440 [Pseudoalteromonas spongiae UST010723-006]|nr:hypothetical protein PSPO_a1440 [Pseudoalteromonas spongiae UST010723-006]
MQFVVVAKFIALLSLSATNANSFGATATNTVSKLYSFSDVISHHDLH